ncbi:MAG: hypothetical protein ABGZ17_27845, partial [Planctomycetaceae bacterium]
MKQSIRYSIMAALVLVVLVAAGWWGHDQWVVRTTASYGQQCRALRNEKQWNALAQLGQEWSEWDPQSADAWLFQAEAAQETNALETAVRFLAKVPSGHAKAIPALILKTNIEFEDLNKPLNAVDTCQQLIRIKPNLPFANQRLIFFYALTSQRQKLIDQITAAIRLGCEPREAYAYLMISDALTFSNGFEVNSAWRQSSPEAEVFIVGRAVQMAQYIQALPNVDTSIYGTAETRNRLMRDYLEQYPHNPALLRYFLHRAVGQGDVRQVGQLLSQVLDEQSEDSIFWRYRGWYHNAHDELDQAEDAYRRSNALYPLDWQTKHELAAVLRRKKQLSEVERL